MPAQFILDNIEKELKEIEKLERTCLKKIDMLPVGSYFERQLRGGRYGYVNTKKDGKVRQCYLGRVGDPHVVGFKEAVEKRKLLAAELKDLRQQKKALERILK